MAGLEKALITNTVTNDRITVQFNPAEYTLQRDVNYALAAVPGLSAPLVQFAHGNLHTLEMELLLDTYEAHGDTAAGDDVRTVVKRFTNLMEIDSSTHAPPVLLFTWGSLSFTCILTRASQRYVMFREDGAPVRARLQVTFQEYRNGDIEAREIKRETADYSKKYVVRDDQTLDQIALETYENPLAWRPIAIRNDLDRPGPLQAGTVLLIPRLPFIDPETGEVMRG